MNPFSEELKNGLVWLPELGMGRYPVPQARPYDAGYFARYQQMADTQLGQSLTAARIQLVARHYQGALLDVGIGSGQFVEARPQTRGYDVNPAGVDWLWGGIGVVECVSTVGTNVSGSTIKKATASVCNAFTVFNQAFHGVTTASSPVPLYLAGGSVHYYRVGSGARLPLPVSATVAALATGSDPVGADGFVWDLAANCIDIYSSSTSGNPKVNISLLMISTQGNLTVKKETRGDVVWENGKPCGLFLL